MSAIPLHLAAADGDNDTINRLLTEGADVNITDKYYASALMIATENGHADTVRLLLQSGADPNLTQKYARVTPLHMAANKGRIDIATALMQYGADIDAETSYGLTALFCASENSQGEMADFLIAAGGQMSVVEAILLQRSDIVRDFWDRGTPINATNQAGMTALHAALGIHDVELISELIHRGADVDATDRLGTTPMFSAIQFKDIELARLLLNHGADPNGTPTQSFTPLCLATISHNEPIVRLLLERRARIEQNLSEKEKLRITKDASSEASTERSIEIVSNTKQLLNISMRLHRKSVDAAESGAEADTQSIDGLWAVVRTLLEHGADANSSDYEGYSLLTSLIEFDAPLDLITFAVEKGADVNLLGHRDQTPLLLATEKHRDDLVALLVAAGANTNSAVRRESLLQKAYRIRAELPRPETE